MDASFAIRLNDFSSFAYFFEVVTMVRCFSYKNQIGRNYLDTMGYMLLTLFMVLGSVPYCYAEKYSPNHQNLDLTVRHQPTEKVIRQLSRLSGYKIEIDQEFNNTPISLDIQRVDLNRALIEVLRALRIPNHAILMDGGNKSATIKIFPPIDDAYATLAIPTLGNDSSDKTRYGIGAAQLKQIKQDYYNRTVSPRDIVSPPSENGRHGITRQEIKQIKGNYRNQKNQKRKDTIKSPPSIDGKPGLTLAEVERIKREYRLSKLSK